MAWTSPVEKQSKVALECQYLLWFRMECLAAFTEANFPFRFSLALRVNLPFHSILLSIFYNIPISHPFDLKGLSRCFRYHNDFIIVLTSSRKPRHTYIHTHTHTCMWSRLLSFDCLLFIYWRSFDAVFTRTSDKFGLSFFGWSFSYLFLPSCFFFQCIHRYCMHARVRALLLLLLLFFLWLLLL